MKDNTPYVSVIMKVYNGEDYLCDAIDSILNQSFENYELLILDDASSDSSLDIIETYRDSRIRVLINKENQGIVKGQNRLINEAKGKYIAVMDCDDISFSDRLEKQVAFLDGNPDYILCASNRKEIIDNKYISSIKIKKYTCNSIKFAMYFKNIVTHSSIMFRSEMYKDEGILYGPENLAEDYGAILDMMEKHPIAILPDRLVAYRIYNNSVSHAQSNETYEASIKIRTRYLEKSQLAKEYKKSIISFYNRKHSSSDVQIFIEAVNELARLNDVQIGVGEDGFDVMIDIMEEFLASLNDYSMKLWKFIRHSEYKQLTSIKTDLGRKLLFACLLKYKKRGLS